ncbi:MAG: flagellar biosynthesis protein FlgJ [Deltaproteobacteria bacterium]|nr:MAG: flagellar biosynthesis protein FlgJ [Deltaproteobacteria bacterium]
MMIEKVKNKAEIEQAKLKEVCRQFEAIFIEYMLKTMRRSIPKSSLFKRENAEQIYTSLFDEKVAEKVAEAKGVGLADMLYKELSKLIPERTETEKGR